MFELQRDYGKLKIDVKCDYFSRLCQSYIVLRGTRMSLLIVPQLWKSQIGMGQFTEIIGTCLGNCPSQMYNR